MYGVLVGSGLVICSLGQFAGMIICLAWYLPMVCWLGVAYIGLVSCVALC